MNKFSLEAKLGIFVLAAAAIFAYTIFRVLEVGVEGGFEIRARFTSVEGLVPEAQVQIAGIKVGKVKSIQLDPATSKVLVIMEINNAYRDIIPEDSRVLLRTRGLLGDKYVAIEPGKPNARKIKPGGELTLVYEPTDTEKIFETVGIVAQDLQQLTREARKQIIDQGGAQKIDDIINNTESISKSLKEILTVNRAKIDRTIDRMDRTSSNVDDIVSRNRDKVNDTVDKFDKLASQLERLASDVRAGKGTLGKLATDEGLYRDVNNLVGDLRGLTGSIRYGRGTIGRLVNDPEIYYEARRAIRNMNKTAEDVSEATPISTLAIILGSVFR